MASSLGHTEVGRLPSGKARGVLALRLLVLPWVDDCSHNQSEVRVTGLPFCKDLPILFYFIFYFIFILAALCSMWDLSSPTRDGTGAPCIGNTES